MARPKKEQNKLSNQISNKFLAVDHSGVKSLTMHWARRQKWKWFGENFAANIFVVDLTDILQLIFLQIMFSICRRNCQILLKFCLQEFALGIAKHFAGRTCPVSPCSLLRGFAIWSNPPGVAPWVLIISLCPEQFMLYHSDVAHHLHFACHVSLTVGTGVLQDTHAQTLAGVVGWTMSFHLFTSTRRFATHFDNDTYANPYWPKQSHVSSVFCIWVVNPLKMKSNKWSGVFSKILAEVLHCRFWRLCTVCCMHVLIFSIYKFYAMITLLP